jgi:hypothetical protein
VYWVALARSEPKVIANPILKEESAQIDFDYLGRSGEIDDAAGASHFLNYSIELIIEKGVTSRLVLSNLAIPPISG